MTNFVALLLAHLFGDWMLQTKFQAMNKAKGHFFNEALIMHCLSYTLCFVPAFYFGTIHWAWLLLIFWSHMFLDRRWPVVWWIKVIKRTDEETINKLFWLVVAVDQVMHVMIIGIILAFTG